MLHTGKFNKIPLRKRPSKNIRNVSTLPRCELPDETAFKLPDELIRLLDTTSKSVSIRGRKTKRHAKLIQSYTTFKKRREEFRKKLLMLIVQEQTSDDGGILTNLEKKILRYHYYLKHGIDTVHVAPLSKSIIVRVHNLLSSKLKQWNRILQQETEDMKEDFMMSMKKSIVDYALRDPDMIESLEVASTSERLEIKERDEIWKSRMQKAKLLLERNLHSINPCIAKVLDIWWKQFIDLRLINIYEIVNNCVANGVVEFQEICRRHIENTIKVLKQQWLPIIQNIFLQGNKKKLIPSLNQRKKMKRFYNCLSCIMTYNLQTLCLKSIDSYTNYILDDGGINTGFYINVIFSNSIISFEPPFKKIKDILLNIYQFLIDACKVIPRLENQLYAEFEGDLEYLKPVIDMDYINTCKSKIHELLEDQRIGPELRVQDFDDFIDLINGEMAVKVDIFLKSDPPKAFDEYCEFAVKFVNMASDIPMKLQKIAAVGIYRINRENVINALRNAATSFANSLLQKMTTDYQIMIKEFGEEYLNISNRLLTAPLNTAALVELQKYSVEVEDKILVEMEGRLKNVMKYIIFLSDYTTFTPLEMKANNNTFQWYGRMPSVLDECRQICETKTLEFQDALKIRINKFNNELSKMAKQVEELQYWGNIEQLNKYVTRASALNKKLEVALTTIEQFNTEEQSFGWDLSQYPLRKQITDKLTPYKKLYDSAYDYLRKHNDWMSSKVGSYNPETIDSDVSHYYKTVYKLEVTLSEIPDAYHLANDVRLKIQDFKEHLPIIHTLGNPGMKVRHWEKVSEIVGFPIVIDDNLTLEKIIDYGLTEYLSKFEIISEAAGKENKLEQSLDTMISEWENLLFEINSYRDSGTYILSGVDDVQLLLDDHIVKTQTMKNSPYIKPFESTILAWEAKLQLLQEILDEWLHVQATWMYLEPIFSSPDIQQQMPEESRKFSTVDKMWREIMKAVYAECRVLDVIEIEKLLERLKKSNSLLEIIQRGLNVYLEKKRLFFPRFFFLSNEELLEILSETKDPTRVQPQLKKCFQGIATLEFTEEYSITHIKSIEEEVIPLVITVNTAIAKGQVEKWLLDLETSMKVSVCKCILSAFDAYPETEREQWILEWAGQAVQCVSMIYWTSEISSRIDEGVESLKSLLTTYEDQILKMTNLIRGRLNLRNRITLGSLIILNVYVRDAIYNLISSNVESKHDFNWLRHLRYYLESAENPEESNIFIRMINSELIYGFEYLGNTSRLIITPLTERCLQTLFGALHFHLGGAAEGPASSGKTETIKDLAKSVAKQCVVFNCTKDMDYLAIGKFFKGLASCGAWSCFDDFNRIDLEVLSVVAQQMMTIQRGMLTMATELILEGTPLTLNNTCAVFITMNPDYIGRTKLPNNLKFLFRSVTMMVPDFIFITEIQLYASGFLNSKTLAVKITSAYRLCFEKLSAQPHYDFGMRAIKSVLKSAAVLKLKHPNEIEDVLIVTSIKNSNLSMLLDHDIPLFTGILTDLFPDISTLSPNLVHLTESLHEASKVLNLESTPYVIEKVLQMYELMMIRHGLIIVGLPFSGKSSLYQLLGKALTLLNEKRLMNENKVQIKIINPKSITINQLYGQFDPITHDWSDGILSVTYRGFAISKSKDRKWLVFDGPIDTMWIENLNTVLDDNRKLCLMSGEVIQLAPTTNLIFETMNLESASPATISRCGIIYTQPDALGWEPLVSSWLNTLPPCLNPTHQQNIKQLFCRFCPPLLWLVKEGGVQEMYSTSSSNLVWAAMNIFDTFMDDYLDEKYISTLADLDLRAQIEGVFFFSIIWSIGATLVAASRPKFDMMFRGLLEKEFPQTSLETLGYPYQINKPEKNYIFTIPKDGSVYDYRYIKQGKGKWKPWSDDLLSVSPIPRDIAVHSIIVPTLDTVRYVALFKSLVLHKKAVMLVGPTGTGKSSYIIDFLTKKLDSKIYKPLIIGFSAQTQANQTQDTIMAKLDKRKKGVFGPPIGTECIIFVDDVSMPRQEKFGAQPAIEILRQALDQKIWYDKKDNTAMKLIDLQFMCAMSQSVSNSKKISPRFVRHFNFLCIDEFDDPTLMVIFSKIMLWHLDTRGFSKEFDPCIEELVSATLNIYRSCRLNLLPTPSKSHYLFNLRDFSRVIQGVLLSVPEVIEDLQSMKRLWIHECMRVFYDRLIDTTDKDWFIEILKNATNKYLHIDFNSLLERLLENSTDKVTDLELRKLIYCDFANPKADTRHYMEISEMDHLTKTVDTFLFEFNNMTKKPMAIVLFKFAIEHVARICRIIGQPRSHALLIGLGGLGKQSLTRLSAHINDHELFQIELHKQYSHKNWREDMKNIFLKACTPDQHVTFLFNETQIKDELFLDDVNSILNLGEIPNLFNIEEKADICERMRVIDKQRDKTLQTDGTPIALLELFGNIVREQLHVVLTMSPTGTNLRSRIRSFPAIVNCCTIDWFQEWPNDAMLAVATHFLNNVEMTDVEKDTTTTICLDFHEHIKNLSIEYNMRLKRHNYVNPTTFVELLSLFKNLLISKRTNIRDSEKRYLAGIEQLEKAAMSVGILQKKLEDLQPKLGENIAAVAETSAKVAQEKDNAANFEEIVFADQEIVDEQAKAVQNIKDECDADLAKSLPEMELAITALNSLAPNDITLMKSMKSPAKGIKLVMEAICLLKGAKADKMRNPSGGGMVDDYWGASKKLLNDPKFIESLLIYDKDNIPPNTTSRIQSAIFQDESFIPEKLRQASIAAEALCKWVIAIVRYDETIKILQPKKEALADAQALLNDAMASLAIKQAQLKEIRDKLEAFEQQLEDYQKQQKSLEDEIEFSKSNIIRAEQILKGLGGEKQKWNDAAEALRDSYSYLIGNILLSAGIIAYLGPFTSAFRQPCINKWVEKCNEMGLQCSENFNIHKVLGDPVDIQHWQLDGLPIDDFNLESAIIIKFSRRWPLIIDPQSQASRWIKNMEKPFHLNIVRMTQADFSRVLENAIQFGQPVLLENVTEELDSILETLLQQQTFKQGGAMYLKFGENIIEYNKNFRFYISTKLRNPQYSPEISVRITLVDFTLGSKGLSNQLLSKIVAQERPELQQTKVDLTVQSAEHKKLLKDTEEKILNILSTSKTLLEDEVAVQTLNTSKVSANETKEKLTVAIETDVQIEKSRKQYEPFALYGSVLYFLLDNLFNVNPMYLYSLEWFENLFNAAVDNTDRVDDVNQRLNDLKEYFTYSFYLSVCRGLLDKDKLIFSLLLTVNILNHNNEFDMSEFKFFLTDEYTDDESKCPVQFLKQESWISLQKLNALKEFEGILLSIENKTDEWKNYYESSDPQNHTLPQPWEDELTSFQKLMLVKSMRRDKVVPAVRNFISNVMGEKFVEWPTFNLEQSFTDSHARIPLIFILTPGSDFMNSIYKFAESQDYTTRLYSFSLGEGQGPIALKTMDEAVQEGSWMILQNCHLVKNWMPNLEKAFEGFQPETTHSDFRLWLTSYPYDDFPITLLQSSIKITDECPRGIRDNILKSFQTEPISDKKWFQTDVIQKLCYSLSFFHAVVQERRHFGSSGWNVPYEFDEIDLKISLELMHDLINDYETIQYEALHYIIGECGYGGRITDVQDERCLSILMKKFCCSDIISDANYCFEGTGAYCNPSVGEYTEYMEFIRNLPSTTLAGVCGMNDNVEMIKNYAESNIFIGDIISTQEFSTPHEIVTEENAKIIAEEVLKRLPEAVFDRVPREIEDDLSETSPISIVLKQEGIRYTRLLNIIRNTLTDVIKAIQGTCLLSEEIENTIMDISQGKIPLCWIKISYPSLKTFPDYIDDLLERLSKLQKWYNDGAPIVYWISGFYYPQSFLTAIQQMHSKKYNISIDQLIFDSKIQSFEDITELPENGVYINGLYAENGKWNDEDKILDESSNLYDKFPIVWLVPMVKNDLKEDLKSYVCPVYQTTQRRGCISTTGHSTNYLLDVKIPTMQNPDYWTLRGVALFTQLPKNIK